MQEDKHMAKKKANGEVTIRQRKNGKWEGRFTYGRDPLTGKQMQRSVYGDSHKEVQQKIREVLTEINNDSYINPTRGIPRILRVGFRPWTSFGSGSA